MTSTSKQPLGIIQVPLNKFAEEVIPHHQKIYENHRNLCLKVISGKAENQGDLTKLQSQGKSRQKSQRQLKDSLYELDSLRFQVLDQDLSKFDSKTSSLRQAIVNLITGYEDLDRQSLVFITPRSDSPKGDQIAQVQVHDDINAVVLKQRLEILDEVEQINRDTEDIKEIFTELHSIVNQQDDNVNSVQQSVESTHDNVTTGLRNLIKAHRIKATAYPVTGAFLGTLIGGPIGLIAGLKIGGLAAVGCAFAGYTGGKILHKNKTADCKENNDSSAAKKNE